MQHVIDRRNHLPPAAKRQGALKLVIKATTVLTATSAAALAGCLLLVGTMSGLIDTSTDGSIAHNHKTLALLSVPEQPRVIDTWQEQVRRISATLPQVAVALLKAPTTPDKAPALRRAIAEATLVMPSIGEALALASPQAERQPERVAKADLPKAPPEAQVIRQVAKVVTKPPIAPKKLAAAAPMPAAVPLPLAHAAPVVAKAPVPLPPVQVARSEPKPVPLPMAPAPREVAKVVEPKTAKPSVSEKPRVLPRRTRLALARVAKPAATAPVDHRSFFEKMFAQQPKPTGSALAYAPTHFNSFSLGHIFSNHSTASAGTAVYNIATHTVTLPDGEHLEAHSGLGSMIDNPRYVKIRMRGPTPPHLYDLTYRRALFHGVKALRLTPVGGGTVYGRAGLLAHSFMLGGRGDSNGCVSFRNYQAFLRAFRHGEVKRLLVVAGR